jgi:hypothetical protein
MKDYSVQRRERLNDVIFDYISDEKTTANELVRDIIKEVRSAHIYFASYENKCSKILDLLEEQITDEQLDPLSKFHSVEPTYISQAKVQASSPYNDGWTNKMYDKTVKDWKKQNSTCSSNVSDATAKDWEDFWENVDPSYRSSEMLD